MTLKDFWAKLKAIPQDKALHLAVGFAVGAVCYRATNLFIAALAAAAIAGVGKEMWDRHQNAKQVKNGLPPTHDVEASDAVFTLVGGAVGAGVVWAALLVFS